MTSGVDLGLSLGFDELGETLKINDYLKFSRDHTDKKRISVRVSKKTSFRRGESEIYRRYV